MCFSEMPSLYCSLFVGAFVLNGAAVPAKQKMQEKQEIVGHVVGQNETLLKQRGP